MVDTTRSMASRPTVPGSQSRARRNALPQQAVSAIGRPGCAQESVGARTALGAHVAPQRSAGLAVSLGQRRTPVGIEAAPMRRGEKPCAAPLTRKWRNGSPPAATSARIGLDTKADRTGRSLAPADTIARGAGRVRSSMRAGIGSQGQPSPACRARKRPLRHRFRLVGEAGKASKRLAWRKGHPGHVPTRGTGKLPLPILLQCQNCNHPACSPALRKSMRSRC